MPQSTAIVYHYWNDGDFAIFEDLQNPVLVSIATLRGHDQNIPIYVIDASDNPKDWDVFPAILNFKVFKQTPTIPLVNTPGLGLYRGKEIIGSYKLLSRPFDIDAISKIVDEEILVHVESDIFWLRPLLPIQKNNIEHFHFNFFNSGFWYYNKNSRISREFFEWWKHHILYAICNKEHRDKVMKDYPWGQFQDEAVMHYCAIRHKINCSIPNDLNLIYKKHLPFEENFGHARNLHFIGQEFPINRGLIGLFVDRFWKSISRVLDEKHLTQIFGRDYLKHAGKSRFDDLREMNFSQYKRCMGDIKEVNLFF